MGKEFPGEKFDILKTGPIIDPNKSDVQALRRSMGVIASKVQLPYTDQGLACMVDTDEDLAARTNVPIAQFQRHQIPTRPGRPQTRDERKEYSRNQKEFEFCEDARNKMLEVITYQLPVAKGLMTSAKTYPPTLSVIDLLNFVTQTVDLASDSRSKALKYQVTIKQRKYIHNVDGPGVYFEANEEDQSRLATLGHHQLTMTDLMEVALTQFGDSDAPEFLLAPLITQWEDKVATNNQSAAPWTEPLRYAAFKQHFSAGLPKIWKSTNKGLAAQNARMAAIEEDHRTIMRIRLRCMPTWSVLKNVLRVTTSRVPLSVPPKPNSKHY